MTEETRQPRPYDLILGGNGPDISTAPVLGGFEGVIKNLQHDSENIKIQALIQSIEYGEAGLDLVIKALQNTSPKIKRSAYHLLKDRTEQQVLEALDNFNAFSLFECLWSSEQSNIINCLAISPDGNILVTSSRDNTIKIWNIKKNRCLKTLSGHSNNVNCVAISPNGQTIVSGSSDNTIKIWDINTGSLLKTLSGNSDIVLCVAISPVDGVARRVGQTIISASDDKTIKIWDINTGHLIKTLSGHSESVNCLAISPNGQTIISGSSDRTIRIWGIPK